MAIYIVHIKLILWSFPHSSAGKESTCNGDPSSIPGSGRFPGEEIGYPLQCSWASLVSQIVKNQPAMWETWIRSPGLGRSPGEGKGYPLQNSMDCIVHGVAKSQAQWSDFRFHFLVLTVWPRDAEESDACTASRAEDIPRIVTEDCILSYIWPCLLCNSASLWPLLPQPEGWASATPPAASSVMMLPL